MLSKSGKNVLDKAEFLLSYYSESVSSATWLKREWSTRVYFNNRYCESESPAYWNPDYSLVYTAHGEKCNLKYLIEDRVLKHWDRYLVNSGEVEEQLCPVSTHDFVHVFMIPDSIVTISQVYYSKNPSLNQINSYNKELAALTVNTAQCINLQSIRDLLVGNGKVVLDISPDKLLTPDGYLAIIHLTNKLRLTINPVVVKTLHQLWLASTTKCYQEFYNKEFKI
tara:strand:- start:2241 stop:2912 length:672 start_codon:yes stop_codon:yes gene_type:complete